MLRPGTHNKVTAGSTNYYETTQNLNLIILPIDNLGSERTAG